MAEYTNLTSLEGLETGDLENSTPTNTTSELQYYTGTEFVSTNPYYYNGSEFVLCDAYYYDGTEFKKI